ncbi:hypothetical protein B5V01_26875 [Mesorhizobium erdmanii]|uniref:Uncharacterized protein n=1 Tax=Mesorhizobium erdmanii TaxID=1777866 RepID=A0A4Q1UP84_9HYPH|nr:hypothetical protein B5V01_26875 [Mesorhizobium erdmanii]
MPSLCGFPELSGSSRASFPSPGPRLREIASLKRLIAADNMTQKENARTETQLAIARAMMRAGKSF